MAGDPRRAGNDEGKDEAMTTLERWGVSWKGQTGPVMVQIEDGYWTPWHIAQAAVNAAILNWGGVAKNHQKKAIEEAKCALERAEHLAFELGDSLSANQMTDALKGLESIYQPQREE